MIFFFLGFYESLACFAIHGVFFLGVGDLATLEIENNLFPSPIVTFHDYDFVYRFYISLSNTSFANNYYVSHTLVLIVISSLTNHSSSQCSSPHNHILHILSSEREWQRLEVIRLLLRLCN